MYASCGIPNIEIGSWGELFRGMGHPMLIECMGINEPGTRLWIKERCSVAFGGFLSAGKDSGKCSTIHSLPAFFFFYLLIF